jgi:hypothetical protein
MLVTLTPGRLAAAGGAGARRGEVATGTAEPITY